MLDPVFGLAAWTFAVLALLPIARFRAGFAGAVTADDFKYGESDRVPGPVSIPNRAYMNLLEMPVLFYVCCLAFQMLGNANTTALALAWAYVGLRIVHSLIHLTYNNVMHRLTAFAASNFVLLALWIALFLSVPR